jgi:hypothetical protein
MLCLVFDVSSHCIRLCVLLSLSINFNDFPSGISTLFELLVVNNW